MNELIQLSEMFWILLSVGLNVVTIFYVVIINERLKAQDKRLSESVRRVLPSLKRDEG
jgi:hypothetical protein